MIRRLASLTLVATAVACSSEGPTAPDRPITAVTIAPGGSALVLGQTTLLTATITGGFSKPTVTWSSSNVAVATVNDTGFVTARAVGSTTISAKAGTVTGTAVVTVSTGVTGVTVTPGTSAVIVGQTMQLTASLAGPFIQAPSVSWGSSNAVVASVNETGRVTANGSGTATITATAAGVTGTATITVTTGVIDRVSVCNQAAPTTCSTGATLSALGTSAAARASAFNTLGADITSSCVFTWVPSATGVVSITFFGDATRRDALITRTGYGVISIIVTCGGVPSVFTVDGAATPPSPA